MLRKQQEDRIAFSKKDADQTIKSDVKSLSPRPVTLIMSLARLRFFIGDANNSNCNNYGQSNNNAVQVVFHKLIFRIIQKYNLKRSKTNPLFNAWN
jgi:hypothetical protein